MAVARRLGFASGKRAARRALMGLALWLAVGGTAGAQGFDQRACVEAEGGALRQACFVQGGPAVYHHGILGAVPEWHELHLGLASGQTLRLALEGHIYEDIAPRLHDMDGDGTLEVVAVQTSFTQGARLVVYRLDGLRVAQAATPYIGRRNRWLAPFAIADMDGDGRVELAYVDRPHLAKVLRIWRWQDAQLRHLRDVEGVTNHKIGWNYIIGGWQACRGAMVLASADWSRVLAVEASGAVTDLGPYREPKSLPGC